MSRREKRMEKPKSKIFSKLVVTALFLISVVFVLKYAYNYVRNDITDKTNLVINNNNITTSLKKDILVKDGVVYISKEDIQNFFDPYIYYDSKYNQIITGSDSKIASMVVGENKITNNGSTVNISGSVIQKNETYYIPFSAIDNVYNTKTSYVDKTNTVVIDSLDRKYVVADSNKNSSVKQERTPISRTVDKIDAGDSVTVVTNSIKDGDDWVKVRTITGKLGYVKQSSLSNSITIREDMTFEKQIPESENVSMIWEYFSEYGSAPARQGKLQGVNVVSPTFFTLKDEGKGEINENVGNSGISYITWAHNNGYKVWPSISNNSYINTTSDIMRDYKLRQNLINKIVSLVVKYDLDGINIDFENMKAEDKSLFNRFIIELTPRLKEYGKVVSVDVTAPDGSENWSMCYDRHTIGKVADYIVYMAYDQNGDSKEGTTAGCDWTEANIKKFVGTQEEIDSKKIILAVPFYTRVWYTNENGQKKSVAVDMKRLDEIIPSGSTKTWDDSLKQYVTEYTKNGRKYKVWIEDEKSLDAKLSLISEYNLAGAAYWKKGSETNSIWNMISNKLNVK